MFVGEFLCLGVYGAKKLYLKYYGKEEVIGSPGQAQAETLHLKTNINPLLLAIPASFDCIASTLMNIALTMVVASVYQMLRGLIIVITAIMSVIFLRRKLYRHHWSSMSVIFIGVFMVGLAKFLDPENKGGETKIGGLALLVVAQLFAGCLLIVEEKLLGDYYLDPLKVVGLEGMWGIIFWCILLPILQQISCEPSQFCPYGKVEDTVRAYHDFGANGLLIALSVCICLSIALFNSFGVSVTKNASAAQRSTIDTSRTVLIWIFFMTVPIYGEYLEHFLTLQLFGFIFLVIGTLVFNEIVVLPFLGFDKFTKPALERKKRSNEKQNLLDGNGEATAANYSGLSPHASYDATRNQRNLEHKRQENEGHEIGYGEDVITQEKKYQYE